MYKYYQLAINESIIQWIIPVSPGEIAVDKIYCPMIKKR
jgi:hypothetical protein